jgi:SAM-dependent methyltransferase
VRWTEEVHGAYVHGRRLRVLVNVIAPLLPQVARVLDIGAGDGQLARGLMRRRPDVTIEGIDTLVRPETAIRVHEYDGHVIPFGDGEFDAAILVDVIHHADDQPAVLREARRVVRDCVIVKDHLREGLLAQTTLRFMDAVGNRRYGVALPYQYLSRAEWRELFATVALTPDVERRHLGLYPWPASLLFERGLHFVARLRITTSQDAFERHD